MPREVEVKVFRTHNDAVLPERASEHAAGWDIRALEETVVSFRSSVMVPTGLKVAIPEGYEGQIRARSSLGKKGLILPHSIGTIDSDYRGDLFVLMTWIGENDSYVIEKGERIAQMVIAPIPKYSIQRGGPQTSRSDKTRGGRIRFDWTILVTIHR